jgi:phage shock protein A
MFDDLRDAFREALDNFNKELKRDRVPETVDRLLVGMKDEIVDEKAEIAGLEAQLEQARNQAAQEAERAATCRRREEMARRIGDEDTASVAAQHCVKHESHNALLTKKASALEEELEFRRRTLEEMMARFTEAKGKREELAATAGRTSARDTLSETDDLFSELDRMAERIEGERSRGEAAEILDSIDFDADSDYHVELDDAPPQREEMDVDAALQELKRRMGQQ